jgi:hypothetical protein
VSDVASRLNRLRFQLRKLEELAHAQPGPEQDWEQVVEQVSTLLEQSPRPEWRALWAALAEARGPLAQGHLPPNWVHLRRLLEQTASQVRPPKTKAPVPLSELEQLRELLRAREVLVVGGDPREHHRENLETELRSARVHWPLTREQTPDVTALEPWVARAEIALVLLYIRFVRHAISDELPTICDRFGKPLARITAGYNPSKVAHQVLRQCSDRL